MGGELKNVLLILNTADALNAFMSANKVTLGANLSVALGPMGRSIEGGGVASSSGETAACYAYSVSRGAFVGVALDGTVLFTRDRLNHTFYGHPASARYAGRPNGHALRVASYPLRVHVCVCRHQLIQWPPLSFNALAPATCHVLAVIFPTTVLADASCAALTCHACSVAPQAAAQR